METQNEKSTVISAYNNTTNENTVKKMKKKKKERYLQSRSSRSSSSVVSFSANLPNDACEAIQESCICAVKNSTDPFSEIRESIVEMVENVGIADWKQMEELIYCYVALNSSELHGVIQDAFLSLCFNFPLIKIR